MIGYAIFGGGAGIWSLNKNTLHYDMYFVRNIDERSIVNIRLHSIIRLLADFFRDLGQQIQMLGVPTKVHKSNVRSFHTPPRFKKYILARLITRVLFLTISHKQVKLIKWLSRGFKISQWMHFYLEKTRRKMQPSSIVS